MPGVLFHDHRKAENTFYQMTPWKIPGQLSAAAAKCFWTVKGRFKFQAMDIYLHSNLVKR